MLDFDQLKFSTLTERIAGTSVEAWAVHYEGLSRREAGEDIIILSVGQETDQYTSEEIVDSAVHSLYSGRHHYTPVNGLPALRQAIADRHNAVTGQHVDENNCAVFAGAQNALFAVCQCLLEHGDEVILIEPYYTTYPATVSAAGATIVTVPVQTASGFQLNPDDVISAMTERTRAILVNSPNNPLGTVYTLDQFRPLVEACIEKDVWLISDEVYQEILLSEHRASPASLPGAEKVCITVSSLSKSHRMTGWRLGWAVGPAALMKNLYNLSMCMIYGLAEFVMDAGVTALQTGNVTAGIIRENMDRRRRIALGYLSDLPGLGVISSAGGMYIVLDVRGLKISSQAFTWKMLHLHQVALLPCDGFGASGQGLVRISLCAEDEQFVRACQRLADFVRGLAN